MIKGTQVESSYPFYPIQLENIFSKHSRWALVKVKWDRHWWGSVHWYSFSAKILGGMFGGALRLLTTLELPFPITGCFLVEIGHKMFICGNVMVLIIIAKYYKQLKCSRTGKWLINYSTVWWNMEYSRPFKVVFLSNILMVRNLLMRMKVGCQPACLHT